MKSNNLQLPRGARWRRYVPFLVLFSLAFLHPSLSFTQSEDTLDKSKPSRWSINLALGNHSVGFPLQNLGSALNPSISDLGLEYRLNKGHKHVFSLASQSSFVHNPVIGHSFLNGLSLNYTYIHRSGITAGMDLGLGHLLQMYPRDTYSFNPQKETYEPSAITNISSSYSGFGLTVGYDLNPRFKRAYTIFLRNKFYIQSPYFNTAAFPILPQNILELGLKINLNAIRSQKK